MNIFERISQKLFNGKQLYTGFISIGGSTRKFERKEFYYGQVYACIDAIAGAVGSNGFTLQRKLNKTNARVMKHPLLDILNKPNPFQTGTDLLYIISSHIDAHGVSYLYPVPNGNGKIVELWALDPARISIVRTNDFIGGFVYKNPKGTRIPFESDELIPIMRPNPFDQQSGVSTIEMARHQLESDINAIEWNKRFFENGANPSGVLTSEKELKESEFTRLKAQFSKKYTGIKNMHKPMLLEGGLKWQQVSLKQKDMDYIEQRKFTRDDILSIFKVPKPIVAISDDVNRANAETAEYVFAKLTVLPRLELIFEKLNRFLMPLFPATENLDLVPNNPVPENAELKLKRNTQAVNKWLTINEVRAEDGYEPLDGGDILYQPSNLLPAGVDTNTGKAIVKSADNDKKYLDKKYKVFDAIEKELQDKLRQHLQILITDIRKKANKAKATKKKQSVPEALQEVLPDNAEEWKSLTAEILLKYDQTMYESAIELLVEFYDLPVNFNLENSGAISWLKGRAKSSATTVWDTLLNRAREVIADQISQDVVDIAELKKAVADTLQEEADWRVERIARTELITSYGESNYQMMVDSKVVAEVKWLSIRDERQCKICKALDGKTAKVGEEFIYTVNGSTHNVLHEPAHIQCRCDVVPHKFA